VFNVMNSFPITVPALPRGQLAHDSTTAAAPPQENIFQECPNGPRQMGKRDLREINIQLPFTPEVRLPLPVPCERLIPFCRIVGSLQDWADGIITDRELCLALRKAAAEVDRGGY
jgi:hypothetical protein